MMEGENEVTPSALSVGAHSIKVTDVVRDGEVLTFIIISQKLSGTGEYHVHRTYEDFEWLQQHLCSLEEVAGLQGIIFPPLPAKAQENASAKVIKQLGFLAMGQEWQPYCMALEAYLHQVAAHRTLKNSKELEIFLTSPEPPGPQRIKKGIFNRLSQAVEGIRKEGHKDVDDFFQTERDRNLTLTAFTKTTAERFLDVVQTEQKLAVACAHFSTALRLCVEPGEDPGKQAFSKICVKISEVFDSMQKSFVSVAENNVRTLGFGLDLDSRYQEAEKEMLFRRTCKLVELEAVSRNAEKAKPPKKAVMEEVKKRTEREFDLISGVAKQEITGLRAVRVEVLQAALIGWCETQLRTAQESADRYSQHLQALSEMTL